MDFLLGQLGVETIKLMEFGIPVWQVALYVACISICMLSHSHRLGIVISYGFVFYWGYILNGASFAETGNAVFLTVYTIFGFVIIIFAIIALIRG